MNIFLLLEPVDILLGADVHPHLILEGIRVHKTRNSEMLAQQTILVGLLLDRQKQNYLLANQIHREVLYECC